MKESIVVTVISFLCHALPPCDLGDGRQCLVAHMQCNPDTLKKHFTAMPEAVRYKDSMLVEKKKHLFFEIMGGSVTINKVR